ncbi:glycoside hydrolase family 25 protein [Bradyrhizobium sp. BRP22]|uniref:glycoside hydrolase family 25 protein n=1 Tax=Bradyrhizobium sp. BRP22 TaxID=2793821 RepID=UPI001CD73B97|nr:glycoside hydrolase family 25 protein [Bradyrhizobium sp. BRP22]MCA1455915.1 glycoside hydrolase family 25 protein [Bradyrhizobium sp. BRP22]
MSDIPVCIDISHHQGYLDFDEAKRAGVLGVIHKATEGTTFIDSARAENCANALAAGLSIATYFWLKPGEGRAQAEFYLSVVDPVPGERVVIDYEEAGCSLDTLRDAVQALLDYDRDLKVTIYSGHLLKEQLGNGCDDFLAEYTDLWLAHYTSSEDDISWPSGTYEEWALWQYSETGEIPGIADSYVDLDRFNGSEAEFLAWINPAGQPKPPPRPEPDEAEVNVAITAPENVAVKVTVNGELPRRRFRLRRQVRRGPDILR